MTAQTGASHVARPEVAASGPVGDAVRTVISTWSAVSPFGLERADLAAGLRAGRRPAARLDRDRWPTPFATACLVPDFDARAVLGRKGTRSMDRVTALAVAAAGRLLHDSRGERIAGVGSDSAFVLGTSAGSAQSIMDFTRDTLVQERPYLVDPARFANTLPNCAAAQVAMWYGLRGPNTTVAGGRAAGLLALNYARRLHRAGRADAVLCGAVEEFSVARAWLAHHAAADRASDLPLGEGCALVLLEPAGRPEAHGRGEAAEVLALEFGVYLDPADVRPALADCLRRAFAAAHEEPDRVWAVVCTGGRDPADGGGEDGALADVVGSDVPVRLRTTDLVGDTAAASAAFALTGVLALAAQQPAARKRTALVTAVDTDGVLGCALLRLAPTGDAPETGA